MPDLPPQFLDVGLGAARRRIACLRRAGSAPGVVWLQGFKSEMVSLKAAALARWAEEQGVALTRFDYSGHGQSGGRFEDGTLGRWIEEARTVLERMTHGPQVLVGSSMGGGIALSLLRRLMAEHPAEAARITALVLIAPAWNLTEGIWQRMPEVARREVTERGVWLRPSHYGEPYPITRSLIEEGRRHLMGSETWSPGRPVTILHGRLDPDVPFAHSERLLRLLAGESVRLVEVADGEHRLSRPQDIALLLELVHQARSHGS
jgi:alpha-beta hydrolase superfamily lysophospholipase